MGGKWKLACALTAVAGIGCSKSDSGGEGSPPDAAAEAEPTGSGSGPGPTPVWTNFTGNLTYTPSSTEQYYWMPTSFSELKGVLAKAQSKGKKVRVSGQRHSQPPEVIADNSEASSASADSDVWLIDLSCYADLGDASDRTTMRIITDATSAEKRVQVNAGVREDELVAFLRENNLMLPTVSAGGFFSIGGMVANDVNGATVQSPIFADTAVAFTLVNADGEKFVIDEATTTTLTPGFKPLQFARVSIGALGIMTSVTLRVIDRPFATTLVGSQQTVSAVDSDTFASKFVSLLNDFDRVETFFNPYNILGDNFHALLWSVDSSPTTETPNGNPEVPKTCSLALTDDWGASLIEGDSLAEDLIQSYQTGTNDIDRGLADVTIDVAIDVIKGDMDKAISNHDELWLTSSADVMFMSYFIPIGTFEQGAPYDDASMRVAWNALQVPAGLVNADSFTFLLVGPMEFRFMVGGDSALAATYTTTKQRFINIDVIGFVDRVPGAEYPQALLNFFATVERQWVAMGGFPHNGKMYGFYDPTSSSATVGTAPFNANYIDALVARRGDRLQAFNTYRASVDPAGTFCNAYLGEILGTCGPGSSPDPAAPTDE